MARLVRIRQFLRSHALVRLGLGFLRGLGRLGLLALTALEVVIWFARDVGRSGK